MPDGIKRKRRQYYPLGVTGGVPLVDKARTAWYALWRSKRFNSRFGLN